MSSNFFAIGAPDTRKCRNNDVPFVSLLLTMTTQVATQFQCVVCMKNVGSPIQQCDFGHLLCSSCWWRTKTCPKCRSKLTPGTRNCTLEKISQLMKFTIQNHLPHYYSEKSEDNSHVSFGHLISQNHDLNYFAACLLTTLHTNLATLFMCTGCQKHVLPPILQCRSGHLLCSSCWDHKKPCPTCFISLDGSTRNLAMEKISKFVRFPCNFAKNGCHEVHLGEDIAKHHKECKFGPICCSNFVPSCNWKGPYEELMHHLVLTHHIGMTTYCKDCIEMPVYNVHTHCNVNWNCVQSCLGHHFMHMIVQRIMTDGTIKIFYMPFLLDTKAQQSDCKCRMEMVGSAGKVLWECPPLDPHNSITSAVISGNSQMIDYSCIWNICKGGNIQLKFTVLPCNGICRNKIVL